MPPRGTPLLLLVEQAYFCDWWGLAWGSLWSFLSILGFLMAQPGGGSVCDLGLCTVGAPRGCRKKPAVPNGQRGWGRGSCHRQAALLSRRLVLPTCAVRLAKRLPAGAHTGHDPLPA